MFESTVAAVNQLRDSLGLRGEVAGKGSLRGVPFLVYSEQKQSGGRRIVKREYPLRDAGGANDLGRQLRQRSFSAVVLGSDARAQRDALIDALEAPGSAELVHPEFGNLQVVVDSFECRSSADEQHIYEFSITVWPAAVDNAPQASQDTALAVAKQKNSLFGSLGETLASQWQLVREGTAGATAVLNAITGVFDDIYDAVENVGVLDDVNQLLGAVTALKGSAVGVLMNAPARLADNVLGALDGLAGVCDASTAFRAYERLGIHLRQRQHSIDVSHVPAAASNNVAALFHLARSAALAGQAVAASGVLTQAIDADGVSSAPRTPRLTADALIGATGDAYGAGSARSGTAANSESAGASSVAATLSVSDVIIPTGGARALVSTQPDSKIVSDWPLFESRTDIERVAVEIGSQLDAAALAAADRGYATDSAAITRLRLLTVQDLRLRGLRLADVRAVQLARTEPALVALYRQTGNAQQWRRLARRNGICHPLFVPGGITIEVIDE